MIAEMRWVAHKRLGQIGLSEGLGEFRISWKAVDLTHPSGVGAGLVWLCLPGVHG